MKGIVEKIVPYKNKSGAFITISGSDYMFYGPVSVRVDERVEFVEGKRMEDGKRTIKEIRHEGIEAEVLPPKPRQEQDRDAWLRCLKAACIYNSKCQCDKKTLVEYADYFYEASKRISGKCKECGGGN